MASYCCAVVISSTSLRNEVSEPRNEQQPKPDRDQVFGDGNGDIGNIQAADQPDAGVVSGVGSDDRANRAYDGPDPKRHASSDANTCSRKQAHDNSRTQPDGNGACGSVGS